MYFSEWLREKPGRAAEVARDFGVSQSAVTQWGQQGVPVARMLEVRDYTKRRVSLEDMVQERAANAAGASAA